MASNPDYLLALGEARSCLAALADSAVDHCESSRFERVLICLDLAEPDGPASWPIMGSRQEPFVDSKQR